MTYREAEDLINVGAYQKGNNPQIDFAIDRIDGVNVFLRQDVEDHSVFTDSVDRMIHLLE